MGKAPYMTDEGYRKYRQSLLLVLMAALNRLYKDADIDVHQSVNRSTYVEFKNMRITRRRTEEIKSKMRELIKADFKLKSFEVTKEEASRLLSETNPELAEKIIYTPRENVRLFEDMGRYYSVYGETEESASCLSEFDIMPFEMGILLRYPHPGYDGKFPPFTWGKKIIQTINDYRAWNEITGISDVFELNRAIKCGNTADIINIAEIIHEKAISEIADTVKSEILHKKIILIAGPSSSGKTTFANRLLLHLRANGITPEVISLDDYFIDADKSPLDEDGKPDFETLESLDVALFSEHMEALTEGRTINVPKYDFMRGKRSEITRKMCLKPSSVVIIEGLHALNERLLLGVRSDYVYKVYCSALTSLCFDNVNPISPTDTRLLRRIIRDNSFRNTSAEKTIDMWKSVTRGEVKYIFPYENQADVIFNSSNIYEWALYRPVAEPLLSEALKKDGDHREKCKSLLELLSYFEPTDARFVPPMSIMREFIGGSSISY